MNLCMLFRSMCNSNRPHLCWRGSDPRSFNENSGKQIGTGTGFSLSSCLMLCLYSYQIGTGTGFCLSSCVVLCMYPYQIGTGTGFCLSSCVVLSVSISTHECFIIFLVSHLSKTSGQCVECFDGEILLQYGGSLRENHFNTLF